MFETGAASNVGSYSNAVNDANIRATEKHGGVGLMHKYAEYLSKQLPVIWLEQNDWSLTEVAKNLRGVTPPNVYGSISPEDWYYVK